jgi:transcriptional regulator with XRE-family HTH domain
MRGARQTQARYLRELRKRLDLKVREISRRSRVFADTLGEPKTGFGHQAVSAWLNGTRNPRPEHRRVLAMIFHVPLAEFNRGCDGPTSEIDADSILKPVIVHVQGHDQTFDYSLTIKRSMDLSRPAIFQHWTDIFHPWPAPLIKHFGRLTATLFGLVPDKSASPLIRYARSLVPLDTTRAALQSESSTDKKIWFLYLPNGLIEVGIAFRDGPWILVSKPNTPDRHIQKYPLSRVDLIGWVTGRILFYLDPLVS